jgi:hypothetical protein
MRRSRCTARAARRWSRASQQLEGDSQQQHEDGHHGDDEKEADSDAAQRFEPEPEIRRSSQRRLVRQRRPSGDVTVAPPLNTTATLESPVLG